MKNLNNRKTGLVLSYTNTVLNMICGIFLSSFLLKALGKTEYGIYQTISSFASYLVLLEFGVGTVMTRNISACRSKENNYAEINKNVSTLWTITHILSVAIAFFSVIFYLCIDNIYANSMTPEQIDYAKKIFIAVTLNLILSFYLHSLNGITLGFEKYPYSSVQNIIRNVLRTAGLTVIICFYRYSVFIAIVDLCLTAVAFIVAFTYSKKKLKVSFGVFKFHKPVLLSALPLCFAIFLQVIINQANNNVDKFIIGIKMSPEAVAMYSVSLYIFSVFSSLMTIPISMYGPQISILMEKGISRDDLSKKIVSPCRLASAAGGLILFGFIAVGRQFINILYGEEYYQAWIIAIILMVPTYIYMVSGVIENILNCLNKRIVSSCILIITTLFNIILTVIWINIWGMTGAAAATALSTVLGQIIIMNIYYAKKLKLRIIYIFRKAFGGVLPFLIIASAIGFVVGNLIKNNILAFIIGGCVYVLIFSAGFMVFGITKEEKIKIFNKLKIKTTER